MLPLTKIAERSGISYATIRVYSSDLTKLDEAKWKQIHKLAKVYDEVINGERQMNNNDKVRKSYAKILTSDLDKITRTNDSEDKFKEAVFNWVNDYLRYCLDSDSIPDKRLTLILADSKKNKPIITEITASLIG